ncbi:MAG: STAS domain-containing protein [Deltaproteobacteria bacterium]|nr:STAS domain-containing protein [Deltaproteobacteria bacterium]
MFEWKDKPGGLAISGEVEISAVERLQELLLDKAAQSPAFTLDMSGVTSLDTAAAQVLAALSQEEATDELRIILSDEAAEEIGKLGFGPLINSPLAGESKK